MFSLLNAFIIQCIPNNELNPFSISISESALSLSTEAAYVRR